MVRMPDLPASRPHRSGPTRPSTDDDAVIYTRQFGKTVTVWPARRGQPRLPHLHHRRARPVHRRGHGSRAPSTFALEMMEHLGSGLSRTAEDPGGTWPTETRLAMTSNVAWSSSWAYWPSWAPYYGIKAAVRKRRSKRVRGGGQASATSARARRRRLASARYTNPPGNLPPLRASVRGPQRSPGNQLPVEPGLRAARNRGRVPTGASFRPSRSGIRAHEPPRCGLRGFVSSRETLSRAAPDAGAP